YGACVVDTVHMVIKVDSAFNATATANPVNGCSPLTTTFTSNIDTYIASHKWNFGDGSPADTSKNPQHIYNTPGTYNVTYIATNGCKTDTIRYTITVAPGVKSTASATPLSGCLPLNVSF